MGLYYLRQAVFQTLSSRFSQIDDLLSRRLQKPGDGKVIQRQAKPEVREFFRGNLQHRGNLAHGGDSGQGEQLQRALLIRGPQVQQQRDPLAARKLGDLRPYAQQVRPQGVVVHRGFPGGYRHFVSPR